MNKFQGGYGARLLAIKNPFLNSLFQHIYPPAPFVNVIATEKKHIVKSKIFGLNSELDVLDIGSGLKKGPGVWLWHNQAKEKITRLDIVDGPEIDIVADATNLPMEDKKYDAVVLQSVIEHVEDVEALLNECVRVLKVGGHIYIEMPFLQGVHGDPSDFWRMTPNGMISHLERRGIAVESFGVSGGPIGALVWLICDLLSSLTKLALFNYAIRFCLRWLFSPFRYFDYLFKNSPAAGRLSSEFFYLGVKK